MIRHFITALAAQTDINEHEIDDEGLLGNEQGLIGKRSSA